LNIIRRLNKYRKRKPPPPRRTKSPWAGFTKHDLARPEPLAICPSPRCRRAKACIAALDSLYCLRTHHGLPEVKAIHAQSELRKDLDTVMPVIDRTDLQAQLERLNEIAAIRRSYEQRQLERWKSGAFDALYGPYRPAGVVLSAPPRAYVEGPKTGVDKPSPPSYRPRRRPRNPGPSCHSGAGD
jgi:hypothetical protein